MNIKYFFILSFLLFSCLQSSKKENGFESIPNLVTNERLYQKIDSSFRKNGVDGCFILYDLKQDTSIIYNSSRASQSYLPASTFKIMNSLVALECGAVRNVDEIIAWDSVERSIPEWNKDHCMRSAIKYSVVWFYQELAQRIGTSQMQMWVDTVQYGNQNIGRQIDNFWLVGDLRITPLGQVEFLKKLILEELPFQKEHIHAVKEILIEDQNNEYVFRAKTGWADFGQGIGWYVGYLEIHGETFIFVNNIDINIYKDAGARKTIVKEILDYAFQINLKI